ncbi:vegetative cell wall protein gp1-like [Dermochelys coriacea]|uniref:vegetative cell wall protein gp1-like n=1 Tax=Dermochelys coriacea TaxID=27794 RepID=UPI0018E81C2E|nr:vegetative cell wall protein gp1-like [Dermochelys coriacea]XP_038269315.1 vegetative cell wall protein gp1-like [Dermochelys coriacea]XP_038269316.1 vegetative cell wall protein gp1-like [Dermochelys coriacea]XP_043346896.1 vegetative cell wall protein gp1-like [Dermochelys coriacea]
MTTKPAAHVTSPPCLALHNSPASSSIRPAPWPESSAPSLVPPGGGSPPPPIFYLSGEVWRNPLPYSQREHLLPCPLCGGGAGKGGAHPGSREQTAVTPSPHPTPPCSHALCLPGLCARLSPRLPSTGPPHPPFTAAPGPMHSAPRPSLSPPHLATAPPGSPLVPPSSPLCLTAPPAPRPPRPTLSPSKGMVVRRDVADGSHRRGAWRREGMQGRGSLMGKGNFGKGEVAWRRGGTHQEVVDSGDLGEGQSRDRKRRSAGGATTAQRLVAGQQRLHQGRLSLSWPIIPTAHAQRAISCHLGSMF